MAESVVKEASKEILLDKYPYSPDQQVTHIQGSQVVFKKYAEGKISILRVVGCGGMEPRALEILRSHKMAMTFFDLLGCQMLEHIICQVHPKLPGDKVEFPKHRDINFRKHFDPQWEDVLRNGSYAICIIPVDAMSPENGGLWVASESGDLPLEMKPGDLLFMHPELLHWSGPNESGASRLTLLTGYAAWGANHRNYPGAEINKKLTLLPDGSITVEQVIRDEAPVETVGKH